MTAGSSLKGKTAVVTGATGLIGRAIALMLADEGADVVLQFRRSRRKALALCREIGGRGKSSWPLRADFAGAGAADLFMERAVHCSGRLDMLVNSASLFTGSSPRKLAASDLLANLRVNAWAPLALCHSFRSRTGRGAIVNLLDSRIAGGDPAHAGYIRSKHVLAEVTSMMAKEFAPGISVNAVAPGLILPRQEDCARGRRLPLRRSGTPGDVAEAVVFLLRSRFITGQTIWVDGGRHIREARKGSPYCFNFL